MPSLSPLRTLAVLSFLTLASSAAAQSTSSSSGASAFARAHQPVGNQQDSLFAVNGDADDRFGSRISVSGDRAAIAATSDEGGGSVHMFVRDGSGNWALEDTLAGPNISGNFYGGGLSLEGDRVVIGAPNQNSTPGAAYVYERSGSSWSLVSTLTASDAANGDRFGISVSLSGDSVLVGAQWDDDDGSRSGAAYLFNLASCGATCTETKKLSGASDTAAGDQFGSAVVLSGARAIIGAPNDDSSEGAVYVFDLATCGAPCTESSRLTASDSLAGAQLGGSLSLSGDRLLVGARTDQPNGTYGAGSAYLFDLATCGAACHQTNKLISDNIGVNVNFGGRVSLDGNRALISESNGNSASPRVWLFELGSCGATCTPTVSIVPDVRQFQDGFGSSVQLQGDWAYIGATGLNSNKGAAYVMSIDPAPVASVTLDGATGWRQLASPEATTVGAFLGSFWTQGFPGADVSFGDCNAFVFDESAATFPEAWTCVGNATDALAPGEGLMVYVFEDDDMDTPGIQRGFPKTLAASSAVAPPASFSFSVDYTDDGRAASQKGWTMLGAPAGTAFKWGEVARTNVNETVYVFDPAYNGGDYRTYTLTGSAGDLTDGIVPPFQGFFVQATAASPTLTLSEDGAEDGRNIYGRRAEPVTVRLSVSDDLAEKSATWLVLSEDGALEYGSGDAVRLTPMAWPRAVLYTTATDDPTPLVTNALPLSAKSMDIPMDVDVLGFQAPIELTLSAEGELPEGMRMVLLDHELGTETELTAKTGYTFTAQSTASGRSAPGWTPAPTTLARKGAGTRFALRIASASSVASETGPDALATLDRLAPNPTSGVVTVSWSQPMPGPARVSLLDVLGREVAVIAEGTHAAASHTASVDASHLAPGLYVVRLLSGGATDTARLTVTR